MKLRAAEREVGRERGAQRGDHVQRRVERTRRGFAVFLDRVPWRGVVEVAVGLLRERERVLQALAQVDGLDRCADGFKRGLCVIEQARGVAVERARLRDARVEVAIDQCEHAVDQVCPRSRRARRCCVAETRPRRNRCHSSRASGRRAHSGARRVVAGQVVVDPHGPALAGAGLAARHRDVLVGGHVVGQVVAPSAQQNCRPDDRVERHVVFADEVVDARVGALPEVAPGLRLAACRGPLDRRREVADHRLEPDVDALVVPALERDGDTPGDVAGDRAVFQTFAQHPAGEVDHVGAPVLLVLRQPGLKLLLESGRRRK